MDGLSSPTAWINTFLGLNCSVTSDSNHTMVCRFFLCWSCLCTDSHTVVRSPEDVAGNKNPFDYVLLCVKALPDVYDLAAVIESVVTPQHTCILINTTHTLGVESHLEERFPTNVVLSLVSGAEITQLGASEFEHHGSTEIWVGPANKNPSIPVSIQNDMAEALAMTLSTGQVDCSVSENIRQQQYERMIGYVHISRYLHGVADVSKTNCLPSPHRPVRNPFARRINPKSWGSFHDFGNHHRTFASCKCPRMLVSQ